MATTSYPALSYAQPGGAYYATIMSASALIGRLEVRRRSGGERDGIQRDARRERIKAIVSYLGTADAILPTPIIVAANEDVVTVADECLVIKDAGTIGHILDGQHRFLGLSEASAEVRSSFQLLVVFVFDTDPFAQATVFTTINGNQKQVSRSLIFDLYDLDPGRSIPKVLHEIVKSLNDDPESPLHRRIKLLGTKRGPNETLSQAAFIDAFTNHLERKGGAFRAYYDKEEEWVIRKIVANSFAGLKRAVTENPGSLTTDFFFRTTGFGGVARALEALATKGQKDGDLSEAFFQSAFARFLATNPVPPDGTGNAAQQRLADEILLANGLHR